jgi:hypothetical protein
MATATVGRVALRVHAQWAATSQTVGACAICTAVTYTLVVRTQLVVGAARVVRASHARVRVNSATGRGRRAIRIAIAAAGNRYAGFGD